MMHSLEYFTLDRRGRIVRPRKEEEQREASWVETKSFPLKSLKGKFKTAGCCGEKLFFIIT